MDDLAEVVFIFVAFMCFALYLWTQHVERMAGICP